MGWYLIDICGEISEECKKLPKKYQTRKAAEQFGKDYFNSLETWQKNLRTEFYVAFGYFNKRKYDFNFSECVNCMG